MFMKKYVAAFTYQTNTEFIFLFLFFFWGVLLGFVSE